MRAEHRNLYNRLMGLGPPTSRRRFKRVARRGLGPPALEGPARLEAAVQEVARRDLGPQHSDHARIPPEFVQLLDGVWNPFLVSHPPPRDRPATLAQQHRSSRSTSLMDMHSRRPMLYLIRSPSLAEALVRRTNSKDSHARSGKKRMSSEGIRRATEERQKAKSRRRPAPHGHTGQTTERHGDTRAGARPTQWNVSLEEPSMESPPQASRPVQKVHEDSSPKASNATPLN
jgi:hypothetical protein